MGKRWTIGCAILGLAGVVAGATFVGANDARVRALQELRWGMFICWSLSTFSGHEWTPGVEDVDFFHPTGFNPDQWCEVAKEAGMGYVLFLTKHHDGHSFERQPDDRGDFVGSPGTRNEGDLPS